MVKKKVARFLSLRYKFLAVILLVLAGGLVALPKSPKQEGINVEQLLSNVLSQERYISTDELAHKLISRDPSFILVDVRDTEHYKNYALPSALNIPMQNLMDEENQLYLNQNQYDVVFYSNDNFHADQAWVLCNRLGYKNLRVLSGGMNQWFSTIINPKVPDENRPAEDFHRYSTRKAASMYFGVMYPDQNLATDTDVEKPAPKKVITVKKKKKRPVEGGC